MRHNKLHWTQRPENKTRMREIGFKGAKTRRMNKSSPVIPTENKLQSSDDVRALKNLAEAALRFSARGNNDEVRDLLKIIASY